MNRSMALRTLNKQRETGGLAENFRKLFLCRKYGRLYEGKVKNKVLNIRWMQDYLRHLEKIVGHPELWVNIKWLVPDVWWRQIEMMVQSVIPARVPFLFVFKYVVFRLEINTFAFASMFLCVSVCKLVFIALYILCAGLCGCLSRSVCKCVLWCL